MSKPRLTIGMAHSHDSYGVWQTMTDLRLDHREVIEDVEIIIIDDSYCNRTDPHDCHSHAVQNYIGWCRAGVEKRSGFSQQPHSVHYHPNVDNHGTTHSRDRIFELAQADHVLVMDCHVKLWPGSVARLIEFYEKELDASNLLQGVLVYDDLSQHHTHFADIMRGNMWGVWAEDPRGTELDSDPFEIPAQGLGVFSSRKDTWLGFNERFRGFGGEEFYIHEKYRQAGRKTLCLPFLRWVHRFMRVGGQGYVNDLRHRVRNYLIGFKELDLPIERLRRYFRDGIAETEEDDPKRGRIPRHDWDMLCLDLNIKN